MADCFFLSDKKTVLLGECMLEVSRAAEARQGTFGQLPMTLRYGGDTLNTAVYLSRLGIDVDYATALSDDNMSQWLLNEWRREGIGCELVHIIAGSRPGLYMIDNDANGDRHFLYWRDNSPAKQLLCDVAALQKLFVQLSNYRFVYLSGITLALLSDATRVVLHDFLSEYRHKGGGKVIFDSNYRPKLWQTGDHARKTYESIYSKVDIALPTLDDEQLIFGDDSHQDVLDRIQSYGINEIALKNGHQGSWVRQDKTTTLVKNESFTAVDATAAGDSFNAAYLVARINGAEPIEAAQAGNKLAATVVQHKGAIIPQSAMPQVMPQAHAKSRG